MLEKYYIEIAVLLFILIYGFALGFKNIVIRIINTINNKTSNQSNLGRYLDTLLILGILYLWVFQPKFMVLVVSKIVW